MQNAVKDVKSFFNPLEDDDVLCEQCYKNTYKE